MKKAYKFAAALVCALTLTACGNKTADPQPASADSTQVKAETNTPYAEPDKTDVRKVQLGGKEYEITLTRKADKALPVVVDEMGKQFFDYRVDVAVACAGEVVFEKSYTKEAFADFLTADEKNGNLLLGMAYDGEKSNAYTIFLGAQFGQIGIEEGPAFSLEIPLGGGASSIVREKGQDTSAADAIGD